MLRATCSCAKIERRSLGGVFSPSIDRQSKPAGPISFSAIGIRTLQPKQPKNGIALFLKPVLNALKGLAWAMNPWCCFSVP